MKQRIDLNLSIKKVNKIFKYTFLLITKMQKHLSDNKLFKTMGYIDGEWVDASNSAKFDVIDPGNGDIIAHVSELGVAEVKKAALAVTKALNIFKKNTPRKRAELLRKWTNLMIENSDDLAKLVCLENGKTYSEALGEVKYAASYLEWYAEEAPRIYGDTLSTQNAKNRTYTIKEPIGVCGFITPWNFPLAMIARKVGAAIAAGCTVVIKPAGETPLSALAIAYLSEIAGFPKGVINIVTSNVNTKSVGKELCQNKLIRTKTKGFEAAGEEAMMVLQPTIDKTPVAARMGNPAEIAYAVASLADDKACWINGVHLHVNGGLYIE